VRLLTCDKFAGTHNCFRVYLLAEKKALAILLHCLFLLHLVVVVVPTATTSNISVYTPIAYIGLVHTFVRFLSWTTFSDLNCMLAMCNISCPSIKPISNFPI
jgi:hypothetical protein